MYNPHDSQGCCQGASRGSWAQSARQQASPVCVLDLPSSSPGAHRLLPCDPVSISALPRLVPNPRHAFLSPQSPSCSLGALPAAALCQLLPTTAVLKASSEPYKASCCDPSEIAPPGTPILPQPWLQPSQAGQLCHGEPGRRK